MAVSSITSRQKLTLFLIWYHQTYPPKTPSFLLIWCQITNWRILTRNLVRLGLSPLDLFVMCWVSHNGGRLGLGFAQWRPTRSGFVRRKATGSRFSTTEAGKVWISRDKEQRCLGFVQQRSSRSWVSHGGGKRWHRVGLVVDCWQGARLAVGYCCWARLAGARETVVMVMGVVVWLW